MAEIRGKRDMNAITKKTYVIAAFSIHESNSIAYKKFKTLPGFLKGIEEVMRNSEPDYISIRVIRESEGSRESEASKT